MDEKKKIVVVGSGIGGMAAGAMFAKSGHAVSVLEANDTYIGGHGRCIRLNGLRYSMGPQYVWDFGEGETGDRFLRFLGIREANPFLPMERKGFERVFVGDRKAGENYFFIDFNVPMGLERFRDELKEMFPEEREGLDALFSDMILLYDLYRTFLRKGMLNESRLLNATRFLLSGAIPSATKLRLGKTMYMTVENFFDRCKISPFVRRILYGHGGIFAENESEMSAIAYIVGTGNYHNGAWYPKKGFYRFFDALSDVITDSGGSVEKGKKVVLLTTNENLVSGALCEDGTFYECDLLFSDISPRLTYSLLGQSLEGFDYTPSHTIGACCLEVEGGLSFVRGMKGRNYWWQDGMQIDYNAPDVTKPPRMLFINSPTAHGFGKEENNGNDGLVMFFPVNYAMEKEIYACGKSAIRAYKEKQVSDITGILERNIFPGISSKINRYEIVSSIDTCRNTFGEFGNAYGRRLSVDEILKGPIKEKNCPVNLFNVSATKNAPGIAAGIYTAALLHKELTGIEV